MRGSNWLRRSSLATIALMVTLPGATWIRLAIWAALGFTGFVVYARKHSAARMRGVAEAAPERAGA